MPITNSQVSISFEVDAGIKYATENAVMKIIYNVPFLSDFLLRPKIVFRSSVSHCRTNHDDDRKDYYQRKVAKIMQDVKKLLSEEPFSGYSRRGNMGGVGNTDLPHKVRLDFYELPSNNLIKKISRIEGIVNIEYI